MIKLKHASCKPNRSEHKTIIVFGCKHTQNCEQHNGTENKFNPNEVFKKANLKRISSGV
jgi:hypothetical protein